MNRTTLPTLKPTYSVGCLTRALTLIGVFSIGTAWAQHPSERVAADYFEAVKATGLQATADFMHPEAALHFKNLLIAIVENPRSPEETNELAAIFGSTNREEIASRSPEAFVRSIMAFADQQMGDSVKFERAEVLGAVQEKDVTHVLMRIHVTILAGAMAKLDVASFKLDGSEWKMLLNAETEGMANAIRAQFPSK